MLMLGILAAGSPAALVAQESEKQPVYLNLSIEQPEEKEEAADPGPTPQEIVERLTRLLGDFPDVTVEQRGDDVIVKGSVSSEGQKELLKNVIAKEESAIDMTSVSLPGTNRMINVDVIIVFVSETESRSVGFDFLQLVNLQFDFFRTDYRRSNPVGLNYSPWTGSAGNPLIHRTQWGSLFNASVDYNVNLANAFDDSVSIVARPHLSTLNRESANFQSGGEIVFTVSGINSGDIKPYSFGIDLMITPTLLAPDENGVERVELKVNASRLTVLGAELVSENNGNVSFDKVLVDSTAVIPLDETLVLSGLYEHESRERFDGTPILRDIPIIKYLFSRDTRVDAVSSTVIVITPRDANLIDEQNREGLKKFLEYRREYINAVAGSAADKEAFKEKYAGTWYKPKPNSYASHIFMLQNSEIYRGLRGYDLSTETLETGIMAVGSASAQREKDKQ